MFNIDESPNLHIYEKIPISDTGSLPHNLSINNWGSGNHRGATEVLGGSLHTPHAPGDPNELEIIINNTLNLVQFQAHNRETGVFFVFTLVLGAKHPL